MSSFIENMAEKARRNPKKIAFPEADNLDILRTAEQVVKMGIGFPVLIGNGQAAIKELAWNNGIATDGFEYFDCANEEKKRGFIDGYREKYSDLSEKALLRRLSEPLKSAMLLLKMDDVQCVAAGKVYTTGDVLVEAMSGIGFQEGIETVSSLGIADIPGYCGPQGQMLGLADCAINMQPDAKQLSEIAIASADTVRELFDWEPRVAMLSFSTCHSAEHESLDVIRQAIDLVHEKRPDISIDGEFQLDSAIVPEIAARKVKRESQVAGRANVLVFPNLHAGNIGVKMIQIFGKANAYGPVLQGFRKPVCDFSRSAPVEEMVGNVAMLVIRAGSGES